MPTRPKLISHEEIEKELDKILMAQECYECIRKLGGCQREYDGEECKKVQEKLWKDKK